MQINNFTKGVIFLSMFLVSACQGPRYAKNSAIQMNKLTLEYETKVSNKIAAEQAFYLDQGAILRCVLSGSVAPTDASDMPTKCSNIRKKDPPEKIASNNQEKESITVKDTVVYSRISSGAWRDAILLAEKLASSQTQPMINTSLIQFMRSGLEEDWDTYRQAIQRQQQMRVELLEGLEKMDQQTERLKTIQKELDKLVKKPSLQTNLKQYLEIAKAINKKLNEDNNSTKD